MDFYFMVGNNGCGSFSHAFIPCLFGNLLPGTYPACSYQKSVKPLAQIDLRDRDGAFFVHVQNNGVGPMTIDRLTFTKGQESYSRIQDSLDIDPKLYSHVDVSDTNKKVIVPGGFLVVFSEILDPADNTERVALFRQQLSALHLKVEGHDIYDNRIAIEKSLNWFARHLKNG